MPSIVLGGDLRMHYERENYTDPWNESTSVVLLHGLGETGEAWHAWVPHLARRFDVIRPDLRGFGRSTVPDEPLAFPWSPQVWADDLARLLEALEIERVHVVAARLGSTVALSLAANHRPKVLTISIISGLARGGHISPMATDDGRDAIAISDAPTLIATDGLESYVRATNQTRLGSDASHELCDWFAEMMLCTNPEVVRGVLAAAAKIDLYDVLPSIIAPTLVVAAAESRVQSIAATADWQSRIPLSELHVMPGDSPHLAILHPDRCAERVIDFVGRRTDASVLT